MSRTIFVRLGLAAILMVGLLGLAAIAVTPVLAQTNTTGVVNVTALNFRAGPGLNYRVLDVLVRNESLSLLGRSANGSWVEVRRGNGDGGWVFGTYLNTNANLAALPVTEAAGGPIGQVPDPVVVIPPSTSLFSLFATITNNQATVTAQNFPANAEVVVKLGRMGTLPDLEVARGVTDANGTAQFLFTMPDRWADGQALNDTELLLQANTVDGKFSQTVTITYVRFTI